MMGDSCIAEELRTACRERSRISDPAALEKGRSALRLADVDHPLDAELVGALAEQITPHLLLERQRDCAALGKLVPVATQLLLVVTAEADGDVVARVDLRSWRRVGAHQGETAVGLQLTMHDAVGAGRVRISELAERVQVERSTEDVLVELHRLPCGVVLEADVGVED